MGFCGAAVFGIRAHNIVRGTSCSLRVLGLHISMSEGSQVCMRWSLSISG